MAAYHAGYLEGAKSVKSDIKVLSQEVNPDPAKGFNWTYHFFWGLEDIAAVNMEMWNAVDTNKQVAAIYSNDSDGMAFTDEAHGYPAIVGPAGLPKTIVTRLNTEIVNILNNAEVKERLTAAGVNVESTTPEGLRAYVQSEIQKMGKAVKASGAKVE